MYGDFNVTSEVYTNKSPNRGLNLLLGITPGFPVTKIRKGRPFHSRKSKNEKRKKRIETSQVLNLQMKQQWKRGCYPRTHTKRDFEPAPPLETDRPTSAWRGDKIAPEKILVHFGASNNAHPHFSLRCDRHFLIIKAWRVEIFLRCVSGVCIASSSKTENAKLNFK